MALSRAFFLVFWHFARKANKWAFLAGAGLYALDGLSILLFFRPRLIDLAFHALALFFMLGERMPFPDYKESTLRKWSGDGGMKDTIVPSCSTMFLPIFRELLKGMAGTTGLEPAASAVTGQRSNQLNYVPGFCEKSGW